MNNNISEDVSLRTIRDYIKNSAQTQSRGQENCFVLSTKAKSSDDKYSFVKVDFYFDNDQITAFVVNGTLKASLQPLKLVHFKIKTEPTQSKIYYTPYLYYDGVLPEDIHAHEQKKIEHILKNTGVPAGIFENEEIKNNLLTLRDEQIKNGYYSKPKTNRIKQCFINIKNRFANNSEENEA